jgi:hypothetical protein
MIRIAVLILLQAAALLAPVSVLAPATALGAGYLSTRKAVSPRIRLGALFFATMFVAFGVMAAAERAVFKMPSPGLGHYAELAVRGFASYCAIVAGTRMWTFMEFLCFLKKIRIPDYIITTLFLMAQDLAVLGRLVEDVSRTVRARGSGVTGRRKIRLLARASKNFLILAVNKYAFRHEHILARGLDLALPLDEWRARERQHQG